jgi:hypothetical protein
VQTAQWEQPIESSAGERSIEMLSLVVKAVR